ncbi:bacterio-opsin activator domain-containing protein [Halomicrobium salinisoli]|uniref:bacterio-opsin activator domain-containing protein n=1 Tax=Halomicrobium salinisoli TaxID=2878391 RepID=UPI001CF04AF8|nr:bacterio-opsin activator domain-containing protein [Halomicrobium salinisoli]
MTSDELDVLLIEDNPGDARLIEEMFREAEGFLEGVDVGASAADGARIHHEDRLSDGLDRADETGADVILLDLNLPDSAGLETLAAVVEATEWMPIVVLTGLRDEQVGVEAVQRGAQDYLVKDEVTSDLLVRSVYHAIVRNRQERERARRREQLEALNRLNRIAQDVAHAVITTSTREELERAVCDRLVESDAYRFAWIGEVDRTSDEVRPRVAAGVEDGYLDDVTIAIDGDESGTGPTARAIRTDRVQVMQNVQTDPEYEPWREQAIERGYRSSAAVPIVYEDIRYGVLNVYAESPGAFTDPEAEILSRLGDVIGHAITAIERKDALVSDTVLELTFQVEGLGRELVELTADGSGAIAFDNLIRSDDALIAYGRVEGVDREALQDAAERADMVDDLRVLTPEGEEYEVEILTDVAGSLVQAVSTHGGRLTTATIEDGEFSYVVQFPPGRDKRQLIELVEEHCPAATNTAQQTVEQPDRDVVGSNAVLEERLTEKQRTALEAAYFAGLFDWPRKSTGQEVADRLGVTPPTFTQHLRAAEQKFFDAVFEDGDDDANPV